MTDTANLARVAESIIVDINGNVGVGTSTPIGTLQVVGNANVSNVLVNTLSISSNITMSDGTQFGTVSSFGTRNRFINGTMDIDQRNNGVSGTGYNVYTIDRWHYGASQASKGTWGQNLNLITPPPGFSHYLGFQSSSSYTPSSSDVFGFHQAFEAANIQDFAWGTANAQTVTLSFWAYSSLTGTFSGSLNNYASTRSYVFTYSIPLSNTWTKINLTIPGDTGGTWVMLGNGGSLYIRFSLGAGSSTNPPFPNLWASGNYFQSGGTVSVVSTSGATFYITGVQLEVGTVATPFERRLYGQELLLCQRYYNIVFGILYCTTTSGNYSGAVTTINLPVTMRASPSIVYTINDSSGYSGILNVGGEASFLQYYLNANPAIGSYVNFISYQSAEL